MRKSIPVLLATFALLYACTPGAEEPPLAVLTETAGLVRVFHAGDPDALPAEEDMELGEGDRVVTERGGSATISFRDEHFIKLSERTSFTLRKAQPATASRSLRAVLSLAFGRITAAISKFTGGESEFAVETPTAVAAVKGTTFEVAADDSGSTISVLDGNVTAAALSEGGTQGEETLVGEGEETVVDAKSRRPSTLRKFMKDRRRRAVLRRLSEFRGKAGRFREQGRSGELHRSRRVRVLGRALMLERMRQEDPAAFDALPDWRKARLNRLLEQNKPELDTRREEIRTWLEKNPRIKKRLDQESKRRLFIEKKKSERKAKAADRAGERRARRQAAPRKR